MEVIARYAKTLPPLRLNRSPMSRRKKSPSQPRVHATTRRLTTDVRMQLAADYRAGHSTPWLMRTYSLGKGSVLRILSDAHVEMRGQGLSDEQIVRAAKLYQSGSSLMALTRQFDASAETIRQALRAAGVQMRQRWERDSIQSCGSRLHAEDT